MGHPATPDARGRVVPFRSLAGPDDEPQDIRARAEEYGFLFCPALIDRATVHALRDAALAVARDLEWLDPRAPLHAGVARPGIALGAYDDSRWIEFLRVMLAHPTFAAVRTEPRLLAVLEAILGAPPEPDVGDLLRVVSPDDPEHTTVAHQDRFYLRGDGARWTAWLPLGDCPLSLGPIAIVPRSHTGGLQPHHGPSDSRRSVAVAPRAMWAAEDLQAGDAVIFNWLTVHCTLPNLSDRSLRLSATCRFRATGAA
jgi:ectoine hydroxylase-related dioxygenase (phytanoyl-CoA dioxygenase family)